MAVHYAMIKIAGRNKSLPVPLACGKALSPKKKGKEVTRQVGKVTCQICLSHLRRRGKLPEKDS